MFWYQVRSECLSCTFRTSCCSAHLSRAQVPAIYYKGSFSFNCLTELLKDVEPIGDFADIHTRTRINMYTCMHIYLREERQKDGQTYTCIHIQICVCMSYQREKRFAFLMCYFTIIKNHCVCITLYYSWHVHIVACHVMYY